MVRDEPSMMFLLRRRKRKRPESFLSDPAFLAS
jgi:hypothetical protein